MALSSGELLQLILQNEAKIHSALCWAMVAGGIVTFFLTIFVVSAPYGRHEAKSSTWGPKIPAKVAWVMMEFPSFIIPVLFSFTSESAPCLALTSNKILLGLFVFHYANRALVFPFRMRGGKPMPLSIMFSALFFTSWNGYLQGRYLTNLSCVGESTAPDPRLIEPHFYIGVLVFLIGLVANHHSDGILRNLRKPGETGYKIPRGGVFEFVSGANFATETLEWIGFAIAANTLPAFAFAVFTFCNVGPRAAAHHKWYIEKFKDEYPASRKAFIPFLW